MAKPPIDRPESPDDEREPAELEASEPETRRLMDRLPSGSPGLRTPAPHNPIPGLRVPKEKLRLAAISMELPDALAALADQLGKAEQFLRKQPGAERAQVALDHVYLPDLHVGTEAFLETRRDDRGNCRVVVSYYHKESEACFSTAGLDEFPIATRIELCKSIPELIDAAVAAQNIIAGDVLTVADAIDEALHRNRGTAI